MEASQPIAVEILARLIAAVVGGLLVAAGTFKLISRDDFYRWLTRFLGVGMSWPVKALAASGITIELLLGAALLLWPSRLVLILAWWFCLAIAGIQLIGRGRKIGPCACFGGDADSRGAMLGPILAPVLLAVVSTLLWFGLPHVGPMSPWEVFMLAGAALSCSLTLLMLIEAPGRLEELRARTQES